MIGEAVKNLAEKHSQCCCGDDPHVMKRGVIVPVYKAGGKDLLCTGTLILILRAAPYFHGC